MLKIAEQAQRSDTGRQRDANEDSYFARAPVFAVADGMGGAQAGEVASRLAAESFESAERSGEPPEAYLRSIATAANARIHRLAQTDSTRSGMGTTLTAALVEDDEVGLAHVGDSRAYLFRDRELKLLTSDHSLVEELRRQGRLTDEQAEDHPQRSIITRALGPEVEVEVDTMTYQARPGDVYLLCSDGLTTMMSDDRIASVLASTPSLDAAAERLVREANEAGGRDNITVVAFRLEEAPATAKAGDGATLVGPSAEDAGLTAERVRSAAGRRGSEGPLGGAAGTRNERRGRRRTLTAAKIGVSILLTVGLAAVAVWGVRQIYFLGSDSGGRLALYRGLPYDLPFDIKLYSEVYSAPIQVASIPTDRRDSAVNHTLRFHADAASLVNDLQAAAERRAAAQEASRRRSTQRSGGSSAGSGHHGSRGGSASKKGNAQKGSASKNRSAQKKGNANRAKNGSGNGGKSNGGSGGGRSGGSGGQGGQGGGG
jgi:PPM family protein phosphatase